MTQPQLPTNPPGQRALQLRRGTFASLRASMLRDALGRPELGALSATASDDFGVALIEQWAYLGDILSFYQERYAQEAYLRTANQRDSLTRMAALLAYRPGPATAAEVDVAFTVEAETDLPVPAGLRIQSVPNPGEKPVKYETVEPVLARQSLNQQPILPCPIRVSPTAPSSEGALLTGPVPSLRPGDTLLFIPEGDSPMLERTVVALAPEFTRTRLTWAPPLPADFPDDSARVYPVRRQFRLFGHAAPAKYLPADAQPTVSVTPGGLDEAGNYLPPQVSVTMPEPLETAFTVTSGSLYLEEIAANLQPGSRLLILPGGSGAPILTTVMAAGPALASVGAPEKTPYAQATVTCLTLSTSVTVHLNQALIYELGEQLEFWPAAYPGMIPAGATAVYLPSGGGIDPTLFEPGRRLLLGDANGPAEAVQVVGARIPAVGSLAEGHLELSIAAPLSRPLASQSARLWGNVARATHGESLLPEILGSGDPTKASQRFTLKNGPVTFRTNPTGGLSPSVTIHVGGVQWREVPSLHDQAPDALVFTTEVDEAGHLTVCFGDGVHGARLPRGKGNVVAQYRQGAGAAGAVRVGSLTNLLDRPQGVRAVTNPMASIPGRDPDPAEAIRERLAQNLQTFGRAVSLRDLELLSATYTGVAKATAATLWNGWHQTLHLTVAGYAGAPVDRTGLLAFLNAQREPNHPLVIDQCVLVPITLSVKLQVATGHDGVAVEAAVRQAILATFDCHAQPFGAPVISSDLYRLIQAVPGVASLVIERLALAGSEGEAAVIPIRQARPDPSQPGRILPAELAVLDPTALVVRRE